MLNKIVVANVWVQALDPEAYRACEGTNGHDNAAVVVLEIAPEARKNMDLAMQMSVLETAPLASIAEAGLRRTAPGNYMVDSSLMRRVVYANKEGMPLDVTDNTVPKDAIVVGLVGFVPR